MEVDATPEPTAEESPDEEVLLESGMVPDYDLPDYDEQVRSFSSGSPESQSCMSLRDVHGSLVV